MPADFKMDDWSSDEEGDYILPSEPRKQTRTHARMNIKGEKNKVTNNVLSIIKKVNRKSQEDGK